MLAQLPPKNPLKTESPSIDLNDTECVIKAVITHPNHPPSLYKRLKVLMSTLSITLVGRGSFGDRFIEAFSNFVTVPGIHPPTSHKEFKERMSSSWPFQLPVTNIRGDQQTITGFDGHSWKCTIMSSYSYLGMHRENKVQQAAVDAAQSYASGNHGPRMLHGNSVILEELQQEIAAFCGAKAALVASSGYIACMGALMTAIDSHDLVIADCKLHDCLKKGILLSGAKCIQFKHNDFEDATRVAVDALWWMWPKPPKIWIIMEAVYSMDGTVGNLPAARSLCDKIGASLIVDEAHGLGVLGETGRGLSEHFKMSSSVIDIRLGTFSKSFSSVGGFVTGTKSFIARCEMGSPGNVFTAGLSAYHAGAVLSTLRQDELRNAALVRYREVHALLLRKLNEAKFRTISVHGNPSSPVIPLRLPLDILRGIYFSNQLMKAGFALAFVGPPATSKNTLMFRLTAASWYSDKQVEDLVKALVEIDSRLPSFSNEVLVTDSLTALGYVGRAIKMMGRATRVVRLLAGILLGLWALAAFGAQAGLGSIGTIVSASALFCFW